jgi:hypothetical protein
VVSGLSRSYSAANVEPISAVNQNCSVAVEEVSSMPSEGEHVGGERGREANVLVGAADTVHHRAAAAPRATPGRLGRGWPWAVAATLLGSAAAVWPLPTLGAAAGIAVLFVAVTAPRTLVGLTVIGVLFVRPVAHLVSVEVVKSLDEALAAVCVVTLPLRRLIDRKSLRVFPGQWWFAVFAATGLLSGVLVGVEPSTLLLSAFVSCKGLMFAWAVAQVDWEERHLRAAAGVGAVVIVLCLLAAAVNMLMPAAWAGVMGNSGNVEYRVGLPSLLGPFTHPLDLGQVMTLAFVALLTWRSVVRRSALTFCLLLGTGLATLLTFRRTAIASLAAAALWLKVRLRSVGVLVTVAAAAPLALVVLSQPLVAVVEFTYDDYIVGGDTEARTILTVDSFEVAAAHFPGGAGFGRFGSAVAADTYSPEYIARGYQHIWGLGPGPEKGSFLTDTEWPAILGETGFFGAAAFVLGLVTIWRVGRRVWSGQGSPVVRWTGLLVMGWTVGALITSTANVVFTGPPSFGMYFGLVGVLAAFAEPPDQAGKARK